MEKILRGPLPEILFGSSQPGVSQAIRRAVKAGKLKKIAPKIYTSNLRDSAEDIIARHRYHILGKLFPQAVISHRSALEGGFASDHSIVLTYKYTKNVELPGMLIRLVKGQGALEDDMAFVEGLHIASRPRAFLENLQTSRSRTGLAKTLTKEDLEKRLDKIARVYGVDELNRLRDSAKLMAQQLKLAREYKVFDRMISALLGTHVATGLQSPVAKARAAGLAYDPYRLELFSSLAANLRSRTIVPIEDRHITPQAQRNFAFFEAYFSNFIEGTEFAIEEAEQIVFQSKIIANRHADSHDILGAYKIVSNQAEMHVVPNSAAMLADILKYRHAMLMEAHEDKNPGHFKEVINRAGSTVFVTPDEVRGTLQQGFELYQQLTPGIARAVFMMFLIAEVHPFLDGNGRVARIMMNAELTAAKQCKIIIPTVYRDDYLSALRRLSRQNDPLPYIRMLERAQRFSAAFGFDDYQQVLERLTQANAFLRADEGKLQFPDEK